MNKSVIIMSLFVLISSFVINADDSGNTSASTEKQEKVSSQKPKNKRPNNSRITCEYEDGFLYISLPASSGETSVTVTTSSGEILIDDVMTINTNYTYMQYIGEINSGVIVTVETENGNKFEKWF